MALSKESFPFDAKADEIDVLAGSLISFLQDPNPQVVMLNRQIRNPQTQEFDTFFSIYEIPKNQPAINSSEIVRRDPIINIKLRKQDCLVQINPNVFRGSRLGWNELWNQFIVTRAHFSRRN